MATETPMQLGMVGLGRGGGGHPLCRECGDGIGADVGADAGVTVAHEAPDEVRAHPPETDHSELHGRFRGHRSSRVRPSRVGTESTRRTRPPRRTDDVTGTLTDTPAWQALRRHHEAVRRLHLRELFAGDPGRVERLSLEAAGIHSDLSKHRVTEETIALLLALAEERGVADRRDAMFRGEHVNVSEDRPALHVALRLPRSSSLVVDGRDVVREVHDVLDRMGAFARAVREGTWRGHTGRPLRAVVNIGIGGSDLGPAMAYEALRAYSDRGMAFRFVSTVVKVFDETITRVCSGSRSRSASTRWVASTFETKRNAMPRSL